MAVDLPGHGHSSWRDDGAYAPENLADDVAVAVEQLAPAAKAVVGMSLGGLTSFELAAARPELVRRLVVVDITPGTTRRRPRRSSTSSSGPQSFPSFDALLQRTMEHNPTRSESSLRRGILHNAHQRDDGSWAWNYDRGNRPPAAADGSPSPAEEDRLDNGRLWDAVAAVRAPLLLVRGSLSPVVDDDDVAELLRRQPAAEVVVVDGAGHSIQGDRPRGAGGAHRGRFVRRPGASHATDVDRERRGPRRAARTARRAAYSSRPMSAPARGRRPRSPGPAVGGR